MKYHRFDPYWQEKEKRAEEQAAWLKWETQYWKNLALNHGNPDWERRRIVHTNQLLRSKRRPVTLPKVWG